MLNETLGGFQIYIQDAHSFDGNFAELVETPIASQLRTKRSHVPFSRPIIYMSVRSLARISERERESRSGPSWPPLLFNAYHLNATD